MAQRSIEHVSSHQCDREKEQDPVGKSKEPCMIRVQSATSMNRFRVLSYSTYPKTTVRRLHHVDSPGSMSSVEAAKTIQRNMENPAVENSEVKRTNRHKRPRKYLTWDSRISPLLSKSCCATNVTAKSTLALSI